MSLFDIQKKSSRSHHIKSLKFVSVLRMEWVQMADGTCGRCN